jgi:hypothetical protein
MAALTLVAATSIAVGHAMPAANAAQDERASQSPSSEGSIPRAGATDAKPTKATQSIILNVQIAGLGREGCDVEVKPANASCKFRAYQTTLERGKMVRGKEGAQHVSSEGHACLELRDVELRGADRVCGVAITVREPGQTPKTVFRGFRLSARSDGGEGSAPGAVPSFTCYLSSPSKVAAIEQTRTRK